LRVIYKFKNGVLNKNKAILLIIIILYPIVNFAVSELRLSGIYKGENLYVENPYSISGVGFCVSEVLVNGSTTTDEINSSFFEIDLSVFNFKYGDFVNVIIKHRDGCSPRILNKEVLTPTSTFEVKYIVADKSGYLTWATINEHGSLPFVIEQYRWNKWVRIGSVKGKGISRLSKYSFNINYHSGKNKFRIKQIGSNKKPRYSSSVEFISNNPELTFIPGNGNSVTNRIFFSEETRFEIFDYYGKLIKTGYAQEVKVEKLKKGTYFLNYDNKTENFVKK